GAPLARAHAWVTTAGVPVVLGGSVVALALGALAAFRGPRFETVDVPIADLHPDLDGFRIVQISDLHVGPNIGRRYVQRVADLTQALKPHSVVPPGAIVDGRGQKLADDVAPLAALSNAYFTLGNHDCYAGAEPWMARWRQAGMTVLADASTVIRKGAARLLIGGVVDPAYARSRPGIEIKDEADF